MQYDELNRPQATGLMTDSNDPSYHWLLSETSIIYPAADAYTIDTLTKTFYDNYAWRPGQGNPLSNTRNTSFDNYLLSASNSVWPYPQNATTQSSEIMGMVTGTKTRVLGTNTYLYNVIFYDDKGRVIQVQSNNVSDSSDIVTTQYSWTSQPLLTIVKHSKGGANPQRSIILTKLTYDALGRPTKTEKKISNSKVNNGIMASSWEVISNKNYNTLGQIIVDNLGTGNVEFLEYAYNIRGWLLGINSQGAKNEGDGDHFFGFELAYDKHEVNASSAAYPDIIGSYSNAQFNGNVSGLLWKSKGDDKIRKYDFRYDAGNRLTEAEFTQFFEGSFNKDEQIDFSVKGLNYDVNGNILNMNQRGWKLGGSETIDSLLYTYVSNSNKLLNVWDKNNDPTTTLGDFRSSQAYITAIGNKTTGATDFTYDGNGNMYIDKNKDIGNIHYNYLNLPDSITVTG
jgi:hypothetical protein